MNTYLWIYDTCLDGTYTRCKTRYVYLYSNIYGYIGLHICGYMIYYHMDTLQGYEL